VETEATASLESCASLPHLRQKLLEVRRHLPLLPRCVSKTLLQTRVASSQVRVLKAGRRQRHAAACCRLRRHGPDARITVHWHLSRRTTPCRAIPRPRRRRSRRKASRLLRCAVSSAVCARGCCAVRVCPHRPASCRRRDACDVGGSAGVRPLHWLVRRVLVHGWRCCVHVRRRRGLWLPLCPFWRRIWGRRLHRHQPRAHRGKLTCCLVHVIACDASY
jgi:hypothetical protein